MSDRTFERAVRDWLDDGSDRTPRHAIDGVLLAVKTTPQERGRRIPWRFPTMTPVLKLAYGGFAIVAILALGGSFLLTSNRPPTGGAATPSPLQSTTPNPTPLPASGLRQFTSPIFGYSISIPQGWSVRAAASGRAVGPHPLDRASSDEFESGGTINSGAPSGALLINKRPTTFGAETGALQSFTQRTAESTCGSPASQVSIEVDGQPAILSTFAACNGLSAEKTFNLWVTAYGGGTQWWQIVWLDVPGNEAGDTVFFAQALATFRFGDIPPAP